MKVTASIYDLTGSPVTSFLASFVGGVYHVGIEVGGVEWIYGYCKTGSGVFAVAPTKCTLGPLREHVALGSTKLRADEIIRVLHRLRMEWLGRNYNVIKLNCIIFSFALLRELNPKLQLPAYCRTFTEKLAIFGSQSRKTQLSDAGDVFGTPEKAQMWRKAEHIMRASERDETVSFSTMPNELHSLNAIPPAHTSAETHQICFRSLFSLRHQNVRDFIRRAPLRKLLLNYR